MMLSFLTSKDMFQVAHLKQLNHMIVDQDVFGLRTIRVPVKKHGIVEEIIRADTEANVSVFSDGRCNSCVCFSTIIISILKC